MTRKNLAASLALSAGVLLSAAGFVVSPSAVAAEGPAALTDAVGDTINRNTNDKLASARTDIVSATLESGAQGIVLSFKTQEMADPATDPNWASKNTFVSWQLDGNGDGKEDSLIRYSADPDKPGAVTGEATHFPGPGQPAKQCAAPASFNPATGYSLTVAPSCLNNPASVTYRVQLTYDTDLAPKPVLAFDVVPDQGLAGPVPIVAPTAPAAAPPAGEAPAPSAAPAPSPAGAPAAPGPTAPKAKVPAAKPAPKPAAKPAPKPAAKPAPAARDSASAAPNPAAPAASPAPAEKATALAATGPSSARWLGALGGALLLLGGFGLMVPADRRSHHIA